MPGIRTGTLVASKAVYSGGKSSLLPANRILSSFYISVPCFTGSPLPGIRRSASIRDSFLVVGLLGTRLIVILIYQHIGVRCTRVKSFLADDSEIDSSADQFLKCKVAYDLRVGSQYCQQLENRQFRAIFI